MADRLVNTEANTRRIAFVESCYGSSGQPLSMPGRVLVGEGVLTKMCRKKAKPRQFFLFNDIIVYGNIILNKKKYNKQHVIPLDDVKIVSVDDDDYYKNGWKIISPSKSFVVYAATATEKAEWMAHINKCVSVLLSKQGKAVSTTEDSPVWVPDDDARVCMLCLKSHFTVLNRRHHCRKCGMVVCSSCSSNRIMLPKQSSKPLRVCATCYETLSITNKEIEPISDEFSDSSFSHDSPLIDFTGDDGDAGAPPANDSSGEDSSDDDDAEDGTDFVVGQGDEGKFYQ